MLAALQSASWGIASDEINRVLLAMAHPLIVLIRILI